MKYRPAVGRAVCAGSLQKNGPGIRRPKPGNGAEANLACRGLAQNGAFTGYPEQGQQHPDRKGKGGMQTGIPATQH